MKKLLLLSFLMCSFLSFSQETDKENDTEENKALNRRTEIILSPNLEKLFELIHSK